MCVITRMDSYYVVLGGQGYTQEDTLTIRLCYHMHRKLIFNWRLMHPLNTFMYSQYNILTWKSGTVMGIHPRGREAPPIWANLTYFCYFQPLFGNFWPLSPHCWLRIYPTGICTQHLYIFICVGVKGGTYVHSLPKTGKRMIVKLKPSYKSTWE